LVALVLTVAAGCGGEESRSSTEPQRLSSAEQSVVTSTQITLHSYCRKIGLYLTRRQPLPSALETEQINAQLDRLIELAREKPGAQLMDQRTLRDLLGDMAEDLEGSNCSDALERKLDQGFATLPQQ
jgi:hypothetical protein